MTEPLGTLLARSWGVFVKQIVVLVVGAVIIGVLAAFLQSWTAAGVSGQLGTANIDTAHIADLQKRVAAGDQAAVQELQQQAQQAAAAFGQNGAAVGDVTAATVLAAAPLVITMGVVTSLLSFVFSMFVLLLALEGAGWQATLGRVGKLFFPLLGESIWVFLRAGWLIILGALLVLVMPAIAGLVMFLGFVWAVIVGPRLLLSFLVLIKEGKGVLASASESVVRTKGYWGKIVGNLFIAGLLANIVLWVLMVVVSVLGQGAALYVTQILAQLSSAFLVIFGVKLGLTIMEGKGQRAAV